MSHKNANELSMREAGHEVCQLKLSFSCIRNYTYIVIDTYSGETAIIDPAWELDTIFAKLDSLGCRPTKILLTHSHFDHVNLVQPLVKRFNSQVYMSSEEIRFYNFHCRNLNSFQHLDEINLGKTKIKSLLTPGHTAGSASFLLTDSMFTGDTVFIEGCGICNTLGGSAEQMFKSIQKLKETIHPSVYIFPGHSVGKPPGQPFRYVMKENIYFQIENQQQFINFRMRKNQKSLFKFY